MNLETTNKQKENSEKDLSQIEKQLMWYKTFFKNATDAVFIIQPETWSVLDVNDYAVELLSSTYDELIGSTLPQFRRIFKLLKKSSSPIVLSELALPTIENENLMVEVSARFFNFDGMKLIQAIARDVSEQHQLTDKLVQTDKLVLLGQLSAGVAHEIRNPLAAVNLNLQILERNIAKDSPEFNYIVTALQGVERITRIVEVTLNFSRPSTPDIKDVNLNALIPPTIDLIAATFRRKEIEVDLKLDDKLPNVSADSKQMQQVFINILTNAADAIKTKGNVKISTYVDKSGKKKTDGRYAVVSISDSGEGIPPGDLPKIFNPFFTRKADGTGLGLPIIQRIIYNHNGIIDVESSLGKGTKFYVKLPILM